MAKDIIIEELPKLKKVKALPVTHTSYPFSNTFDRELIMKQEDLLKGRQLPSAVSIDVANYTKLAPYDILQEGDEYYWKGDWIPTSDFKHSQAAGENLVYRRPLKNIEPSYTSHHTERHTESYMKYLCCICKKTFVGEVKEVIAHQIKTREVGAMKEYQFSCPNCSGETFKV